MKGVSAVVRGDRFVSKRFSGEDFAIGSHAGVSEDRQTDGSCRETSARYPKPAQLNELAEKR